MVLKARRLFYVHEWSLDPAAAPVAGLWAVDTRFLDPVRVAGAATIALSIEDRLVGEVDATAAGVVLTLTADFRDLFEVRGWKSKGRGVVNRAEISPGRAVLGYTAPDGHRLRTIIDADSTVSITSVPNGVELALPRPGRYRFTVTPDLPPGQPPGQLRRTAAIRTGHDGLDALLAQSAEDIDILETEFPDGTLVAAGMPWYVAPFGRDILTCAWQTVHVEPDRAAAALRALASIQGRHHDPVTAEQPGRIIHETRYGELARLGDIPHRPYYGSVDATPLFLMVAAETLAWGNDADLAIDLAPAMDAALEWIETWGDPDGDGLVEYALEPDPARVPPLVARHQVWKDSRDSLHHIDGSEPAGPIVAVEVQGYVHRALVGLADLAATRGEADQAAGYRRRARKLSDRINDAFWIEDESWYAQALDGHKTRVAAVASNGAQLLFSGLVPPERASAMAQRMLQPDLFSGWGVRTLSTGMAHYDPLSYHNGSVWPHDNGIIADGCYRTGQIGAAEAIFRSVIDLAAGDSLAELYSGEPGELPPVATPEACRPQAWAAGVVPQLVRSCLGLQPSGDALTVNPALPSFLERVVIEGLTFQGDTGDLVVERDGNGYRVEAVGLTLRT